ncbi:YggS family pyridoxal phosphate-dependent enzyme [Alteromonas gilva]|uniref:Pyridoxal phosphate homeostasis protein n=1 Tax=Alteromonas gilva TaxID=2987522 RepID=A0ABT5L6A7_9ALTE|nr:YggS family pyridoxal phosphate-dependent enzyme [Alteromonas gilva]MDC8832595.1 YggS family pyridoxal phosphate-dependent enzyme [Alteromonas gilva]
MQTIADRLINTRQLIHKATVYAKRPEHSVQLLAVSKTKPVSDIKLAYEAGQRMFGENYIQEGVSKIQTLNTLTDIEWHMIGPIQSNKTKIVAEHFDWVQSVDRLKIARRLNEQRPADMPPLNVCIQLNIDEEESKSGITPKDLPDLVEEIVNMPKLTLRGLMAIPANNTSPDAQHKTLATLQTLFNDLASKVDTVDTLSVGMSNDMQAAIEYGSTMVRIGTAIFGARQ